MTNIDLLTRNYPEIASICLLCPISMYIPLFEALYVYVPETMKYVQQTQRIQMLVNIRDWTINQVNAMPNEGCT